MIINVLENSVPTHTTNGCKVFKFDFAPVTSHNYAVRLTEAQYSVIYQMDERKRGVSTD
jgi:hypothetical protein